MRTPCCHTCLAFVLKFLNFLQTFIGVSIIIYSAYMLNQWHHHHHAFPPTNDVINALNYASDGSVLRINLHSLPAPWFIYAFMGIGILVCCITCIGHIAAEAINGCCLCFYAVLTTIFVLLEAGLVAFIAIDHQWEKDLPVDPTGEVDRFRTLIEDNADVFEWVGIAIIIIQGLSLVFAIILRSLVSGQRIDDDDDIEGDYNNNNYRRSGSTSTSSTREPLLNNPFSSQTSHAPVRGDSDIWSSRLRQKYGLNNGDGKQTLLNQNTSADTK